MILCTAPQCQTTAGCICGMANAPISVHIPILDAEFICEVPPELGRVTKLRIKGGKVTATTESGIEMIVPTRRVDSEVTVKTAEEVLTEIDSYLLANGYDSGRQDQSQDHETVGKAFWDFMCDWQQTKSGEMRDEIERLRSERKQIVEECGRSAGCALMRRIALEALEQSLRPKEE